jgi:SAM-dependent methyltransferase
MKPGSPAPVWKAYARLPVDDASRVDGLVGRFAALLKLTREVESPLLRELKPTIALALKWRFDFLAKTRESPFELEEDVEYWLGVLEMLAGLGGQGWFGLTPGEARPVDAWRRTGEGFDLGWTTTTAGERFAASREIARERLEQILGMLGGPGWVAGKEILDSGCGPGRYIDLLRAHGPRRIVGLDQGAALVAALRERFAHDGRVEIVQGTCERLAFPDASFDFVISNGVLHHTPSDLRAMIRDHARLLRPGGVMFIMLVGKGGLELEMWRFVRNFLYDVPLKSMLDRFGPCMSPLRLQGIVDHMYGEYQETSREEFERWGEEVFTRLTRVPGVAGLDVTPELYADDPYFTARFGAGQLRYLCYK